MGVTFMYYTPIPFICLSLHVEHPKDQITAATEIVGLDADYFKIVFLNAGFMLPSALEAQIINLGSW